MDVSDLPYDLVSKSPYLQLTALADILNIPKALVANGGEKEISAMVSVILYRHLDAHDRRIAMESIHDLDNQALKSR